MRAIVYALNVWFCVTIVFTSAVQAQQPFEDDRVQETICTNTGASKIFKINGKKGWSYIILKEKFDDTDAFEAFLAQRREMAVDIDDTFTDRSWEWRQNLYWQLREVEKNPKYDREDEYLDLFGVSPLVKVEASPKVSIHVISNPMESTFDDESAPYAHTMMDLVMRTFYDLEEKHEELKGTQNYHVTVRAYVDYCVTAYFGYRIKIGK